MVALTALAAALALAVGSLAQTPPPRHARTHAVGETPRAYAQRLAAAKGWTGAEWDAIREIIEGPRDSHGDRHGGESGWNPCAVNPGRSDCGYDGSDSCGIPQANPCPAEWRGRLGRTWRAQVRWLMAYFVTHGYGDPLHALYTHRATGSY